MTDDVPINPETGEPYERRRQDKVLEKKLEAAVAELTEKITRIFLVIGVFLIVGTFVFGVVFLVQSNQSSKIQQERYDSLVQSCGGQNDRHDEAIRRVDRSTAPPDIKQQRKDLIDALQPKINDCVEYAKQRVKE